jgi:hypothetical protein
MDVGSLRLLVDLVDTPGPRRSHSDGRNADADPSEAGCPPCARKKTQRHRDAEPSGKALRLDETAFKKVVTDGGGGAQWATATTHGAVSGTPAEKMDREAGVRFRVWQAFFYKISRPIIASFPCLA